MKPEELEGRELDKALVMALNPRAIDVTDETHKMPNFACLYENPHFHESLDALKEVEPRDMAIVVEWHKGDWAVTYHYGGRNPVTQIAKIEPLARARALLGWLTREKSK